MRITNSSDSIGFFENAVYSKSLSDYGIVDVHAVDDIGSTALHKAVEEENIELIQLLIEAGADVNAATEGNETPLYYAVIQENLDIASLLLTHGANVNIENCIHYTPLFVALHTGCMEIADLLLAHGASTNLLFVGHEMHYSVISWLLEHGANVNEKVGEGQTFLHLAASNAETRIVKLLIKHNAEVNAKTDEGCTPLYLAALIGRIEVSEVLIDAGAEYEIRQDEDGEQEFVIGGLLLDECELINPNLDEIKELLLAKKRV